MSEKTLTAQPGASTYQDQLAKLKQTMAALQTLREQTIETLCRHYWTLNPQATASYVNAYREMWDDEEMRSPLADHHIKRLVR